MTDPGSDARLANFDQAPIAAGAGSRAGAEAKVPNRLFDPTPVIPTAAISPINDDGPMTWTGCKYGERPAICPGSRPGFSNKTSTVRPVQARLKAS